MRLLAKMPRPLYADAGPPRVCRVDLVPDLLQSIQPPFELLVTPLVLPRL